MNPLLLSLITSTGIKSPQTADMLKSRSGCLLSPAKALSETPRVTNELLPGPSVSSHPVETSTAHGVFFYRRSFHLPNNGLFLWSLVPATDLPSDLLLLKPCPLEMLRLVQIFSPSPDNRRLKLISARSTIEERVSLLVGLASFDSPLTLHETKPTTKISRGLGC